MSHLARNRFYPDCICSWMLGFEVVNGEYAWVETLVAEDPDCPINHDLPGNGDAITEPPRGERNEGKDQGSTGPCGHLAARGNPG